MGSFVESLVPWFASRNSCLASWRFFHDTPWGDVVDPRCAEILGSQMDDGDECEWHAAQRLTKKLISFAWTYYAATSCMSCPKI